MRYTWLKIPYAIKKMLIVLVIYFWYWLFGLISYQDNIMNIQKLTYRIAKKLFLCVSEDISHWISCFLDNSFIKKNEKTYNKSSHDMRESIRSCQQRCSAAVFFCHPGRIIYNTSTRVAFIIIIEWLLNKKWRH